MKRKLNILVISNMYPSDRNRTFGIFIKNQVIELRKRIESVDVLTVKDPRTSKIHILKKYTLWLTKMLVSLISRGKEYDVVHAHYVFPSGILALLYKKLFGVKMVVTSHGGDLHRMARLNKFIFKQTKLVLHQADEIIAVGEELKKIMIEEYNVPSKKITVLNMGVDRTVFLPVTKDEAKARLHLSSAYKHLLYAGNLIEAKGISDLIAAYQILKQTNNDLQLHLIGSPNQPMYLDQLKQWIKEEQVEGINIYPAMEQKDIALWMAAVDLFVLPSHMEGFGLVALEAMSCHTPVVGSDVGGLSHLLRQGAGIMVQPGKVTSLVEGIQRGLYDDAIKKKLVIQGELKAQQYDQQKLLDELVRIYCKEEL